MMGFAEPVIGPATSGRTRWLNPSYGGSYPQFQIGPIGVQVQHGPKLPPL
jgi:hypothetical protein